MKDVREMVEQLRGGETATHRRHAALALGSTKEQGLVPVLVERLRAEEDGRVREDITWAIVQHADEAETLLREMLVSDDPSDRFSGAHVISKVGDPAYFEAVSALVADEHVDVALKAYRATANTGGDRAPAVLAQRLGDGDELQRDALSDAFRRLGEASVRVLVDALASDDDAVREHALEALGYLGHDADAAVDAIEVRTADDEPAVRLTAVSALGQLGEVADDALRRVADAEDAGIAAIARQFLRRRQEAA